MEPFPPSSAALTEPNGLLAVGGDLSAERLVAAYQQGIFPWFSEGDPILWWTPNPRAVLFPPDFHVSRSLRRAMRKTPMRVQVNTNFDAVIRACAAPRAKERSTWISPDMMTAYKQLHTMGYAHSIEIYQQAQLVGGLYGIGMGRVFFGESMFSLLPNTSKMALAALAWLGQKGYFELIDCQVESDHLSSLGARNLPREVFENYLARAINVSMTGVSKTQPTERSTELSTKACSDSPTIAERGSLDFACPVDPALWCQLPNDTGDLLLGWPD